MYVTIDKIKSRVEYDEDDFNLTTSGFEDLLTDLEQESRDIINSYKGDITFLEETDKTQEFKSLSNSSLPLEYPVRDVSKVEYKRMVSDNWRELEDDRYDYTEHNLILRKYPRNYNRFTKNRRLAPLEINSKRLTWSDFSSKIKVTYDRGWKQDNLPQNLINVQLDIINLILRKTEMERVMDMQNPENIQTITNEFEIMNDDIKKRLDQITDMRNFVRTI